MKQAKSFLTKILILSLPIIMGFTNRGCSFLEPLFFTNCGPDPGIRFNGLGGTANNETILVSDEGRIYISDTLCFSGFTLMIVQGNPNLNDMTFWFTPGIGNIIIGDNGTLIRLTPDFQIENLFNPAGSHNLNAISDNYPVPFQEPDLVAVGDMGTVIKSTDFGLSWFQLNFPFNYNLNDCYIRDNEIFISGDEYSFFKTTNNGETWIPVGPGLQKTAGSQNSYNRIYFYDDNLGFVGGPHGLILKTTDGGNSWQTKVAQGFSEVYDLYFVSPDSGAAVGPNGVARFTTDGGETWFEDEDVTNYLDKRDVKRIVPFGKYYGTVIGSGGLSTFIAPDSTYLDSIPGVTSVEDDFQLPTEFALYQNYPNPFNPATSIQYQVSSISQVSLKVYDLLGREVATLVNEKKYPGNYTVEFDASGLSSGIYFYQLSAGYFGKAAGFTQTKKFVLIK
jgi:photosystem II stability/assembly factor-like uncharacterized protein